MTLYIILENSNPARPIIRAICEKIGLRDYYILDPAHDEIKKSFKYVLFIGKRIDGVRAIKEWLIPLVPSKEMLQKDKIKVMNGFKSIKQTIDLEKDKLIVRSSDLPELKDLDEFVNNYAGNIFEVRLKDKRLIGIYPDDEKLQGKYDMEYHASYILNMCKIKDIFNPVTISVKEM